LPGKVRFSGDEIEAEYSHEIGDETVTSQKLCDTDVTSDETFELSFEEYYAREEGAKPVPGDAADGGAVTCDETFELSFEKYDAGEEGIIPEPELAAERGVVACDESFEFSCKEYDAGEERPKFEPETAYDEAALKDAVHVRQLSMESTVAVFDHQNSIDSDAVYLPKDKEESTKLDRVLQSESSSADNCSTRDTSMPPSESANVDNCLCTLPEVVVPSFLSVDTKCQLELMGRFACTCADILFDDISVESFQSLVQNAASVKHKNFGSMNTESIWNENGSSGVDDTTNINEKVTTIDDNPDHLMRDTAKFEITCTCADILFDDISVESFQSVVQNAALVKHKNFVSMNTESNWNENGSSGVDDTTNINEKVTTIDDNPNHLLRDTAKFERMSIDHGKPKAGTSKIKFGLWKRLTTRKKITINKSGKPSLKKLSNEAKMAIEMAIAVKDVNRESAESSATFNAASEPLKRFEAQTATEPLKCMETQTGARPLRRNKTDPDIELLRGESSESKANWSMTVLNSQIMRELENAFLPEEDDPSYQSESALSKVEEGGTIVEIFADNDDMQRHASFPIFVEGQKGAIPNVTGASSTVDAFQTINEAETVLVEGIIQFADSTNILESEPVWEVILNLTSDSIEILDTKSLWKGSVDPNTGHEITWDTKSHWKGSVDLNTGHEITWTVPPNFINPS
jgi:hypothetical protein